MKVLLFLRHERDRDALIHAARSGGTEVLEVFDATKSSKVHVTWSKLVSEAHRSPGSGTLDAVILQRVSDIPGGLWTRVKELRQLGSLGLRLLSLEEPWLTLEPGQAKLLGFLAESYDTQVRERIRTSLAKARAEGRRVGRPASQVHVPDMAKFRADHSLRETARKFGIGASTAWRLLKQFDELRKLGGVER